MTVFFDLNSKKQNKRDAMYAFVLTSMSREAYKAEYDEDPSGWPDVSKKHQAYEWVTDDSVIVAEYFRVEKNQTKYVWFKMVDDDDAEEDSSFSDSLFEVVLRMLFYKIKSITTDNEFQTIGYASYFSNIIL